MYTKISDFYSKIDAEGGMYEAVTSYGLKPEDLCTEKYPEIAELFSKFVEKANKLSLLEDEIISLMYVVMDEEDAEDE